MMTVEKCSACINDHDNNVHAGKLLWGRSHGFQLVVTKFGILIH